MAMRYLQMTEPNDLHVAPPLGVVHAWLIRLTDHIYACVCQSRFAMSLCKCNWYVCIHPGLAGWLAQRD